MHVGFAHPQSVIAREGGRSSNRRRLGVIMESAVITGCPACAGHDNGGEQRQIVIAVADAAERLGRPQRLAPRQAERAERIGIGQSLQHARA
jgi:hypothetical protein